MGRVGGGEEYLILLVLLLLLSPRSFSQLIDELAAYWRRIREGRGRAAKGTPARRPYESRT